MSVTTIERLQPSLAVRPPWWVRLYRGFLARQERRAQRVIDQHAYLLVGREASFARHAAEGPGHPEAATWNAVLAGMTCEAGAPVRDAAPIDFSRL